MKRHLDPVRVGWMRFVVFAVVLLAVALLTVFLTRRLRRVLNAAVEREQEHVLQDPAFRPPVAMWMVDGVPGTGTVCRVVVRVPAVRFEPTEGGVAVRMKGQAGPLLQGSPDLPVFTRAVRGHPEWTLKARAVRADYTWSTQGVSVAAVEARETTAIDARQAETGTVRRRAGAIYSLNRFWPDGPVEIVESMMGANTLARVAVCPVQYNPRQQILRVSHEVEFELYFEP